MQSDPSLLPTITTVSVTFHVLTSVKRTPPSIKFDGAREDFSCQMRLFAHRIVPVSIYVAHTVM